ncbi:MAG: vitamin K epoxide reductase [Chloroflexota bacterium]|nr:vitamin K epoxide reductase [Chloroflexota bacterium]
MKRPEELSLELRQGSGPFLARRRRIAGLSFFAVIMNGIIALYQLGIIKHLPDPPLPRFDSDKVDSSRQAYGYFSTPDGALAVGSYAATLGLAAMGGRDRATTQPWIPLLMAAKIAFDNVVSTKLTIDQWTKHRAFCIYCLLASAATFATAPLAVPEGRAALRRLTGRGE